MPAIVYVQIFVTCVYFFCICSMNFVQKKTNPIVLDSFAYVFANSYFFVSSHTFHFAVFSLFFYSTPQSVVSVIINEWECTLHSFFSTFESILDYLYMLRYVYKSEIKIVTGKKLHVAVICAHNDSHTVLFLSHRTQMNDTLNKQKNDHQIIPKTQNLYRDEEKKQLNVYKTDFIRAKHT